MSVIVKEHPVTAVRIAQVSPLRAGGQITSPDAGVLLLLEDNTRQRWLIEEGSLPVVGSYLVHDAALRNRYVVTAAEFANLFTVVNE